MWAALGRILNVYVLGALRAARAGAVEGATWVGGSAPPASFSSKDAQLR